MLISFYSLSLTVLFFLLAAKDFTSSALLRTITAFKGMICGLSAIYLAMAELINEQHGSNILPIGKPAECNF